ncbi:MAG: efflux RND transporter periplasmic adaptor subunit [Nakamurella sp.]
MMNDQQSLTVAQQGLTTQLDALTKALGAAESTLGSSSSGGGNTQGSNQTGQGSDNGSGRSGQTSTPTSSGGNGVGAGSANGTGSSGRGSGSSGTSGASNGSSGNAGSNGNAGSGTRTGKVSTGGSASGGAGLGASGSGGQGKTSKVPTAADLASDQSSIDVAQYGVAQAQQNLASAKLTAPIAGTVAAVDMSAGDQVSAGSTTETITILGPNQWVVNTTVPLSVVDNVKVGNTAQIVVNGVAAPVSGAVSFVGSLTSANGGTTTTTTYPVTIVVDAAAGSLFDGSGAMVTLTVASVNGVLTVPTSAVTNDSGRYSVQLMDGTNVTTTDVTVGAIGADRIQILSGLKAGQQVVLADLQAAIPTATQQVRGGAAGVAGAGAALGGAAAGGAAGGGAARFGGRAGG